MTASQVLRLAASGALVLALVGCGGPGTATPTSSPKPTKTSTATGTPTPTPTPEPTADSATLILVLPNLVGVRGGDGDPPLADYTYLTPIGTISAGLTGFFGFAPVVTHVDAQPEGDGVTYTSYDWEGFELRDWDLPSSADPFVPEFQLYSEVGAVRGIAIATTGLAKVGDSTDSVAAANSDVQNYTGEGGVAFTSIRVFPMEPINGRYGPISLAVRLDGHTGGVIDFMLSPWPDMQM